LVWGCRIVKNKKLNVGLTFDFTKNKFNRFFFMKCKIEGLKLKIGKKIQPLSYKKKHIISVPFAIFTP
jgi:hypothetical protein